MTSLYYNKGILSPVGMRGQLWNVKISMNSTEVETDLDSCLHNEKNKDLWIIVDKHVPPWSTSLNNTSNQD